MYFVNPLSTDIYYCFLQILGYFSFHYIVRCILQTMNSIQVNVEPLQYLINLSDTQLQLTLNISHWNKSMTCAIVTEGLELQIVMCIILSKLILFPI